jgi:hypothetical protein
MTTPWLPLVLGVAKEQGRRQGSDDFSSLDALRRSNLLDFQVDQRTSFYVPALAERDRAYCPRKWGRP